MVLKCGKCKGVMKAHVLPTYEFEEGIKLHNVECYKCPKCGKTTFTEKQVLKMEKR